MESFDKKISNLKPMLFKNITYIEPLKRFIYVFVFVFVHIYIIHVYVFVFHWHHQVMDMVWDKNEGSELVAVLTMVQGGGD